MDVITHIIAPADWQAAQAAGEYCAASLASEGFIHCSTPAQVDRVWQFLYADQPDLLVLTIDPARLTSPLKYEGGVDLDEQFPHIYGPLNLDAVARVDPIGRQGRRAVWPAHIQVHVATDRA